jgi:PD-(D/E)XK nuclease superfamily protein
VPAARTNQAFQRCRSRRSHADVVVPSRYGNTMAAPKGFKPKIVGDRACAMVLARLLEVFDTVLLPFGENQRYDLVVDTGNELMRVQCKTGRLREGTVRFAACSNTYHHPYPEKRFHSRNYVGGADLFGVYCPTTTVSTSCRSQPWGVAWGRFVSIRQRTDRAEKSAGPATTRSGRSSRQPLLRLSRILRGTDRAGGGNRTRGIRFTRAVLYRLSYPSAPARVPPPRPVH